MAETASSQASAIVTSDILRSLLRDSVPARRSRPPLRVIQGAASASSEARPDAAGAARVGRVEEGIDQLVERVQRGDRAAFAALFRRHAPIVTGIAYRMLGRSPDLEDVVQEVFVQVHRSLGEFRGQAKFSTWLHRVAVNVCLMHRRRARSRPQLSSDEFERDAPADSQRARPDLQVDRERRIAAFHRLLERLSEKKREVFVLHEIEGLPPSEIATLVGCPVLTVRTRLFYARKELGEMMRDEPSLAALVDALDAGSRTNDRTKPETEGDDR
ncbi:MAG: sigma-70 family RNA polymerase sigma factor [Deltaproteobacteria bacterium]|nr:sigma-70 family RNA polymerase sigma factor [Deltaproteobacteria bacterium]